MPSNRNLVRLAGAAAAIACASALAAGVTAPAQASGYYQVINGNSSNACLQVMDTQGGGEGYLILATCNRSAKQVWSIAGGIFQNPASGYCLDGNGAKVYALHCNNGDNQHWTTTSGSPKSIRHDKSGKYLHGTGTVGSQVIFQPTIGTASRWVIDQV